VIGSLRFFENANFSVGSRLRWRELSPDVRLELLLAPAFCLVAAIDDLLFVIYTIVPIN